MSLDELLDVDLVYGSQEDGAQGENAEDVRVPILDHWERAPVATFRKSRRPSAHYLPLLVTAGLKPSVREEPVWSATLEDLSETDDDLSYLFRKARRKHDLGKRKNRSADMPSRGRPRRPDDAGDGEGEARCQSGRRRKRHLRTVGDGDGSSSPDPSSAVTPEVAFAFFPGCREARADDGAADVILSSADEEFDLVLNMDIRPIDDAEDSDSFDGCDGSADRDEECRCGRRGPWSGDDESAGASADEEPTSSSGSRFSAGEVCEGEGDVDGDDNDGAGSGEDEQPPGAAGLPLFPFDVEVDPAAMLLPLLSLPLFCPLPPTMPVLLPTDAPHVDVADAVVMVGDLARRAAAAAAGAADADYPEAEDDAGNSGDETCSEASRSPRAAAWDGAARAGCAAGA